MVLQLLFGNWQCIVIVLILHEGMPFVIMKYLLIIVCAQKNSIHRSHAKLFSCLCYVLYICTDVLRAAQQGVFLQFQLQRRKLPSWEQSLG